MEISEWTVVRTLELGGMETSWLAVRQPALVRFLEESFDDPEVAGVAVDLAARMDLSFEVSGCRPVRLVRADLQRASETCAAELDAEPYGSLVARQPAWVQAIERSLESTPVLLGRDDRRRIMRVLLECLCAMESAARAAPHAREDA